MSLKAKFNIKIARPTDYCAVSNMPLINTSAPDSSIDGRVWDSFEETPLMPTYLVAFLVSDLDKLSTADGKLNIWAQKNVIMKTNYTLMLMQSTMEFLEEYTGIKYTLPKLDSVADPCFNGGMENWGLIVYNEWIVLRSYYQVVFLEWNLHSIVVHELAHMWFGNLVTPAWWDDMWLKEGFATYFEFLVNHHLKPDWQMDERFVVNVQQHALIKEEQESHPIIKDIGNPRAANISTYTVYDKAACIIRMMAYFLTHGTFQKGLRKYLKTYAFGVADADDMFKVLDDAQREENILPSGINVKTVMDSWTRQNSFPILHIQRLDGHILITQKAFVTDGEANREKNKLWWVPISYTTSANINFTDTQARVWLRGVPSVKLQENLTDSHWIILNLQVTGFYRVNYDQHTWSLITKYMNTAQFKNIHLLNRAQLLHDAFFFVSHSDLNITTFLDLSVYLIHETEFIPWSTFFTIISVFNRDLFGSDIYDSFRHYVLVLMKKLHESVNYKEQMTDTHMTKVTRFNVLYWACYLGYSPCVKWAAIHYTSWLQNPSSSLLSLDLKTVIYCTAMSYDRNVEWQNLWETSVVHNTSMEMLNILTSMQCSDHLQDIAALARNLTLLETTLEHVELETACHAVRNGLISTNLKVFNKQLNYTQSMAPNLLDSDVNLQERDMSEDDFEYSPLPEEIYRTMKIWLLNFERHNYLS
ncbi:hypothetical protein L9F63_022738 [Diploptera punctata]|uniref:Aminopeptidase n=1 Tax=Diploptera punctata TaxID=6984 RepID=A0AAD8EAP1_DIPPU|nr:hypothetical protein L9F63_022738 [Diploptera punctata]